jgi:GT2 family glycosyltransferase
LEGLTAAPSGPQLSVVVASHNRPLRLRWLLNALEDQTLDGSQWEVVVAHDSHGTATDELLASHPLARAGRLRSTRLPPGSAPPGANRNAALRLARAPTVVFTDDDCRPPAGWLQAVLDAARADPRAVVQGPVEPDPDELVMLRSPFPRTQSFGSVPRPWLECANVLYPRAVVEALGGFCEDMRTGEDAELGQRARTRGVPIRGERSMLTYHAVEEGQLWDRLREVRRWGDLALLIERHPELRSELFLRVFWKRPHATLLLALLGLAVAARAPGDRALRLAGPLVLALPWARERASHGTGQRGRLRQLANLPGWALIDLFEIATLARAGVKRGTAIL